MLKTRVFSCGLALCLGAVTALAAPPQVIQIPAPHGNNTAGTSARVLVGKDYGKALAPYKAQNQLTAATNQRLTKEKSSAGGTVLTPGVQNGSTDTIPYFNSWFLTGSRNSIYTYSMVGHSPKAGGTTLINNMLIPLEIQLLDGNGKLVADFNPAAGLCAAGSDISLTEDSPIYNIATYPGGSGLPSDTGQFTDTQMRAQFHSIRAANWHTQLNTPLSVCQDLGANNHVWFTQLDPSAWAYLTDQGGNIVGEAMDINAIGNVFAEVLSAENSFPGSGVPNNTIPVILTDAISAYVPATGGGATCCVLGFHTAQAGIQDPNGILVWAWATFLPPGNIFSPLSDVSDLSHEMTELFNDPFVNTSVAPWMDGSGTFSQGNLETGDVIEAMAPADALFQVTLTTPGNGTVTYTEQNEALLSWFTRTPLNGGVYSWPNTHTLSQCPHVLSHVQAYCYGEGSAGFLYGPPY